MVDNRLANRPPASKTHIDIDPLVIEEMVRQSNAESGSFPSPLQAAALINMPALPVEMVISLPTTWPDSWYPKLPSPFDDLWFWRAISWPVYTLPLWRIAGRSIDALRSHDSLHRPRIRATEAILMGIVSFLCGFGGVGLFFWERSDPTDEMRWAVVPGLIWLSLGLTSVVAWLRQKRLSRRTSQ